MYSKVGESLTESNKTTFILEYFIPWKLSTCVKQEEKETSQVWEDITNT